MSTSYASSCSRATIHAVPAAATVINNYYTTNIHSPVFNVTSANASRLLAKFLRNDDKNNNAILEASDNAEEESDGDETYVPDEE